MFITLLTFIIVLGVLVFVHELGHFIAARRSGVKVEEFGLGFPPRIIGIFRDYEGKWKRIGPKGKEAISTIYSLNLLPLGGFVKIKGEQGEKAEQTDSFAHQSIGRRILIISSGVLMNVFFAFILLSIGFGVGFPQIIDQAVSGAKVRDQKIQIVDVFVGLPAQKQGLQFGDTIVSADGHTFFKLSDLQNYLESHEGQTVLLELKRGREIVKKEVVPEILEETGRAGIGVSLVNTGIVSYSFPLAIWQGFSTTIFLIKEIIFAFLSLLRDLVLGRGVTVDISGPVGIAVVTGEVARQGVIYILQFAALLSLNLAVINFFPFPALDGGRVIFLLLEKSRGKAVSARVEAVVHNVGFALLMLLVILVTYRDIFQLLK